MSALRRHTHGDEADTAQRASRPAETAGPRSGPSVRDSADVVVFGAGPAGLGAALRLARAGRSVVVLERSTRVGGLAASFDLAGLPVDFGSHRLHPSCAPDVFATLHDLLGADLQLRTRNGRMRLSGQFVPFPPRVGALLRALPASTVARLLRDAAAAPVRRPRSDNAAEYLRAALGPTMLELFYGPYFTKIWGCRPEELSAELARRRVSARGPADLVRKALRRDGLGGRFFYPRRGFGQIVQALADAAVAAGAEVRTGADVTEIHAGSGSGVVRAALADGSQVEAGHAVSTLPVGLSATLLRPAVSPAVAVAITALRSRGVVLVYLVLERSQWSPYDAHYLPGLDTPVARVSEPKNYRASAQDPDGVTVLCAELPASVGDGTWNRTDEDLGALVAEDLARQGLPTGPVAAVHVERLARVYPVYHRGYERDLAMVQAALDEPQRLLTIGRHGSFAHDNSHHALDQAWAVADALATGSLDRAAWTAACARFAAHVVED